MDAAVIAAVAAVSGSMVGALGSFAGTLVSQRYHDRRGLLAAKIAHLEALYSDFISESSRLLVDALESNVADPKNLVPAYALLSRIRLSSSPPVLAAAEAVLTTIIDLYPRPNLPPQEIRSGKIPGEDCLKHFSDTCRTELDAAQRRF